MTKKELKIVQWLWEEFSYLVNEIDECEECNQIVDDTDEMRELRGKLRELGVQL